MRSPSQALAWSAFKLSWPVLLMQIAGVISVFFLLDLALDSGEDTLKLFEVADGVIVIGLIFLYSVTLHKSHSITRTSSALGFPYRAEFSLPVSTFTLLLTPLLYICALIEVAVFVPGIIVNLFYFNVEVSVLPIGFIVFQFTILTLMLTWWTNNGVASAAGWFVALVLYLNGLLMPDFVRIENSWIVSAVNPVDYIVALLFTAAIFGLAYFGVSQQRSGETLINFGNKIFNSADLGAIRDILPLPSASCPTNSPMAAEFWKERQLHGAYSALFFGLAGAAMTLAILATIVFFAGNGPDPKNVGLLALPLYGLMCVGLTITMYGVRYKNGTPIVSLHDRTTPLSTAKLTLIRASVSLSSALLAGVIMYGSLWILGPLLFSDFQSMQSEFLEIFTIFTGIGFVDLALRIFLSLTAFLTALLLLATFFTGTMLHNRPFAIGIAFVPAYIFLWSISLMGFYGSENPETYNQAIDTVFANHLWILVLLIPVSLVIMLRDLLQDQMLSQTQMLRLLTVGIVLAGLNLIWLFDASHYDVLGRDIWLVQLSYLVVQGFLPLLAAVLALWTSNRIRHG